MPLAPGIRLGPYEILSALGVGGMGEVYKGRDMRLDRTVAIKVLPIHLVTDPDFRTRFDREARVIAALSHPHICTLYDVGHQDGVDFLVMEYLEGETLADRLTRGALPLDQALKIAIEIADALEKAHRQGIVHRDLKPGNVMLTKSGAKLLDFGLAKLRPIGQATPIGGLSAPPTAASPLTGQGTIIGTLTYMAPEQVEGQEADTRTDIFALGAVVYEMATGQKPFSGTTQASLISSILRDEPPPISQIQRMTPTALDRVVRTCLAKDPDERWQSAGDVAKELRWVAEGSAAGVAAQAPVLSLRRNRERLAWAIAGVALVLATAAGLALSRPRLAPAPAQRVFRTNILLPENVSLNNAVISPDGTRVVFEGTDASGKVQLWIRPLDSYTATPLAGTDDAVLPFWSPDGRFIGFFANKKMKRVESGGGSVIALYDVDGVGGAWAPNGDILFSGPSGPIYRLPSVGGQAVPATKVDASRGETSHRYPFLLPDGTHFLYLALNLAGARDNPANRLWVGALDGAPAKPLIPASYNAQYADGHLLFIRGGGFGGFGGSLFAQPFDPARLEVSGQPVTVADQVARYLDFLGYGVYSVATTGTLVLDASRLLRRLEWYDRKGSRIGVFGEPGSQFDFRISPEGSRIAVTVYDTGTQTTQIWVSDISRSVRTRLTSGPGSNGSPIWSPDGLKIAFETDRKHQADVYVRSADGSGTDEALTDHEGEQVPMDWSRDGQIVYADREAAGGRLMQLSVLPLTERKPFTLLPRSPKDIGFSARVSPDGRWVVYDRDESGRSEVYVVSFPDGRGKVQISTAGGVAPKWTRGGKEIIYNDFEGKVMAVEIDASRGLRAGTPKPLFQLPEAPGRGAGFEGAAFGWDVTVDGERFLVNVPVIRSSSAPLNIIMNWQAMLPAREK